MSVLHPTYSSYNIVTTNRPKSLRQTNCCPDPIKAQSRKNFSLLNGNLVGAGLQNRLVEKLHIHGLLRFIK